MPGDAQVRAAYVLECFAEKKLLDSDGCLESDEPSDEYCEDVWELPIMPTRQKSDSLTAAKLSFFEASPLQRQQSAPSPVVGNLVASPQLKCVPPPCATNDVDEDADFGVILNSFQLSPQLTEFSLLDDGFCRQETEQCWPVWPPAGCPLASADNSCDVANSNTTTTSMPGGSEGVVMGGDVNKAMMMQACAASAMQYMLTTQAQAQANKGDSSGFWKETPDSSNMRYRRKYPSLIDLAAEKQQLQQPAWQQQNKINKTYDRPKPMRPVGGLYAAFAHEEDGTRGHASGQKSAKFCPYCGSKALHQFKFCQFCGHSLSPFQ